MKVLVTGGAGFIGSHTIKKLLDLKYEVVCVDNFNDYYDPLVKLKNVAPFKKNRRFSLYKADINDLKDLSQIFEKEKPQKICHLAAYAGIRASIRNPRLFIKTNIEGTLNLLELSVKYNIKNFILASSSSVYGNNRNFPFSEEDRIDRPISQYAMTKSAGEMLGYTYHHLYNLNLTILRLFSVYGPSGRPDMAPFLFTNAIYKRTPIVKYGNGKSMRDYTYIEDIVYGIVSALRKDLPFEIINLGNNRPVEINYLIALIEKILGRKAIITKHKKTPGEVNITCADISKAKKILGYSPKTTIEEGMKKFIKWFLKNNDI
jgi:UDP-glucuronate 4-epimerase